MKKRHACVLGASGFLGSHLVHHLLCTGWHVNAFDRIIAPNPLITADLLDSYTSFPGNFFETPDLMQALEGCDVCFHLISTSLPKTSNENPLKDVQQNLEGSLTLLECIRNSNVHKIIYSSSGGTVYGIPQTQYIREDQPTEPLCSYGIVKLAFEKYLALYRNLYGLDYTILRISNPYGPLQRTEAAQGVIGVFLGKILRNESLTIFGDGTVVRDYLHVSDVARAFVLAAQTNTHNKIFNIGSGVGESLNTIINLLRSITGMSISVNYEKGRIFDVPYSVLDITKAGAELGWSPILNLEEGLRDTWAWLCHQQSNTIKC